MLSAGRWRRLVSPPSALGPLPVPAHSSGGGRVRACPRSESTAPINARDPSGLGECASTPIGGVCPEVIVEGPSGNTPLPPFSLFSSLSLLDARAGAITSLPSLNLTQFLVPSFSGQERPRSPNEPCSARPQPIAWTPDGDTKGDNPTPQGGRWNTDLPGGYGAAMAVFEGLSRLDAGAGGDGGYRANLDPRRPTTTLISNSGNIGLRWGIKGGSIVWRVDIAAGTFSLKKAETIHFNGEGRGNMCPSS